MNLKYINYIILLGIFILNIISVIIITISNFIYAQNKSTLQNFNDITRLIFHLCIILINIYILIIEIMKQRKFKYKKKIHPIYIINILYIILIGLYLCSQDFLFSKQYKYNEDPIKKCLLSFGIIFFVLSIIKIILLIYEHHFKNKNFKDDIEINNLTDFKNKY